MSSFTKPSTPTKSKPIFNDCVSTANVNHSTKTTVLDEINLLLHLETLKRTTDNEFIVRQKIEESYKLFEERQYKYYNLVAKYATLIKLAYTRNVLQSNDQVDLATESTCIDAKNIIEKLSSCISTDYVCTAQLEKFKQMLHDMEKYKNLPKRCAELADFQNAIDAIQNSIEAIEISLEKCTTQGLDHFTDSLSMDNFPKILKKYEEKEQC